MSKSKEKENLEMTASKKKQNLVNIAGEQTMYCTEQCFWCQLTTGLVVTDHKEAFYHAHRITDSDRISCSCGRDRYILKSDLSQSKMLLYRGRMP